MATRFTELLSAIVVLASVLVDASPASAHAFETRYDLPLPLTLFITGAGAAVAFSFFIVVRFVRDEAASPKPRSFDLLRVKGSGWLLSSLALNTLRSFSVVIFGLMVIAGLFGDPDPSKNILPTFLWVVWWVGMAFISALFGNLWALVNPWKVLFSWFETVFGSFRHTRNYPIWLGRWPAVILFLAFSRLIPHPPNFTPIISMALLSGYFFSNIYLSIIILLISIFVSDLFLGFYENKLNSHRVLLNFSQDI